MWFRYHVGDTVVFTGKRRDGAYIKTGYVGKVTRLLGKGLYVLFKSGDANKMAFVRYSEVRRRTELDDLFDDEYDECV